ncbi:CPXCG motif-containing cysteine-rich protein [Xanthomonas campestris]|uniref:CPXCG motif-containing cysteine-rich protein n=1 Tax=Xanthomonas campestris TaxID=339 RepID=UPI003D034277
MSDPERFVDIACPYCGEWITLVLDLSGGDQHYIEDCQVWRANSPPRNDVAPPNE